MTSDEIRAQLTSQKMKCYTATAGLLRILDKPETTTLNFCGVSYYLQECDREIACIAEAMLGLGVFVIDEDGQQNRRWWPSKMDKLRDLDFRGVACRDNPPYIKIMDAKSGTCNLVYLTDATQAAVDEALESMNKKVKRERKATAQRIAAERELNRE